MSLANELTDAYKQLGEAINTAGGMYRDLIEERHKKVNSLLDHIRQLEKDAELGAAVRKMPHGFTLEHYDDVWIVEDISDRKAQANTPDEALKKALGE